jgi:phage terminase large subunit GpA-like protein
MDALNDPLVERVVVMASAQLGKTEFLLNAIGFHIHIDPCGILFVLPTKQAAKNYSKERVDEMFNCTPVLRALVKSGKKNEENTIENKSFPGGILAMVGANVAQDLAGRPIRLLVMDEIDRMDGSANGEGDVYTLAEARTLTFWNRKILVTSTPTDEENSKINQLYLQGDQRKFFIPCPKCNKFQDLTFQDVRFEDRDPASARIECRSCGHLMTTNERNKAVRNGHFRPTAAPIDKKTRSFHLSALYSPFVPLNDLVAKFLKSKDDPSLFQPFVNTMLGEPFTGTQEISEEELMQNCEKYAAEVPRRALYLTIGADTQPDRLEYEVVAWGAGEESWSIDYGVIHGDPDIPEGQNGSPWHGFTDAVRKIYRHESGAPIYAQYTFIDSGGHNTQAVYDYVKRHKGDRIFAVKGQGGDDKPIVGAPNRKQSGRLKRKVDLYIVGVNNAKSVVTKRLGIKTAGPGYCHFPEGRDVDYFRQLTAERREITYYKGKKKIEWVKPKARRNEALDCRVYAFAAFVMASPQLDKVAFRLKKLAEQYKDEKKEVSDEEESNKSETKEENDKVEIEKPAETVRTINKPRKKRAKNWHINQW